MIMNSEIISRSKEISTFIQQYLESEKLTNIDPITATHWLIRGGFLKEVGTRPGSYLRNLCRKGLIIGAEKIGSKWQIMKIKN